MFKVFTLLFFTVSLVQASCDSNRTCLEMYLTDTAQNGWDGAMLYLETPWGDIYSNAPSVGDDPVIQPYCTDRSGAYVLIVTNENETSIPANANEILWTVTTIASCNATAGNGTVYTGVYNTSMVWDYDADTDTWSLAYSENLFTSTSPTLPPTITPSALPSLQPSHSPSCQPTFCPSLQPVLSVSPSALPSSQPSDPYQTKGNGDDDDDNTQISIIIGATVGGTAVACCGFFSIYFFLFKAKATSGVKIHHVNPQRNYDP
jgi:hypothetical protein